MNMEKTTITYIQELTLQEFQNINTYYNLDISKEHLQIIFQIIKNNAFALANEKYHDILCNYIEKKTSPETCLKAKKLICQYHFYFNPVLNV